MPAPSITDVLILSVGAVLGATLRWLITVYAKAQNLTPYSTTAINISGSFILGVVTKLSSISVLSPSLVLLLGTGFCGAYTTFSTFSVDVVTLINSAQYSQALALALVTNVLAIFAAFIGFAIV